METFSPTISKLPLTRLIYGIWAIAILAPLIYFPAPSILIGHPWKVELIISFILTLTIGIFFFKQNTAFRFSIDRNAVFWTIIPPSIFVVWSAVSVFWANSTESVIHHSLAWAVYIIFFLFAAKLTTEKKILKIGLTAFSLVIGAIAVQCIVEHTFSAQIGEVFGFRFARYAEIHAAVLPLFLSFILRFKRRHLWWSVFLVSAVWLAILFSMSRGSFLSAIAGLAVFVTLRIFTRTDSSEKKRLICAALGLILIAFLVQFSPFGSSAQPATALTRLTNQKADDADNSLQRNVRFLFAGVGVEMFKNNSVFGVGADNFGLEFNKYRLIFSADEKNKFVAGQQEALLPERAHNEYLQILTELGLIGGAIFLLFIFGIFRLSFEQIKNLKSARNNILVHAAFAGIVAFLISSLFSSFSFRLAQNGIVFFFLLALLLKNYFSTKNVEKDNSFRLLFAKAVTVFFIFICFSSTIFSGFKAASQYLVYTAETEQDSNQSFYYFKKAEILDPTNASANYLFGLRLFNAKKYAESSIQLKKGLEKGLNSTPAYSMLASSYILAGDTLSAENTFKEAVEIFPYSVFMQVRYASILKDNNKEIESQKHFKIAEQINADQTKIWWTFVNKGAAAANKDSIYNKNSFGIDKLDPWQAVPFVLAERESLHPEEVVKF